ncbi:inositol monophosphatase family protein [Glycomyces xiaoerkulensis]|uniref:inositol monophosphatase family protein n=1 Tax=Glycomyces xiaoerkulensis TaxID=2038139 RepID=UPI000C26BFCF|nr:inositol monophosphatase family protein [Glycomyces xiaoerkulensis]
MSELLGFLGTAERAVAAGVEVIEAASGGERSISGKGDRDFATDVDFAVEDGIRAFLSEATPEIPLLGEERGRSGDSGSPFEWVLDPVDGTVNFARGSPIHAVSLALTRGGTPVVGVVAAPQSGEWFSAAAGCGATLDGRTLAPAGPDRLADAVVSLGDFAVGAGSDERNDERLALLRRLVPQVQRIRMIGSAALDMCWVAAGRLDATFHDRINLWDVAAGAVIVQEAGGAVTDGRGRAFGAGSTSVLACAPGLHAPLIDAVRL